MQGNSPGIVFEYDLQDKFTFRWYDDKYLQSVDGLLERNKARYGVKSVDDVYTVYLMGCARKEGEKYEIYFGPTIKINHYIFCYCCPA